jgi:hypothetical protein
VQGVPTGWAAAIASDVLGHAVEQRDADRLLADGSFDAQVDPAILGQAGASLDDLPRRHPAVRGRGAGGLRADALLSGHALVVREQAKGVDVELRVVGQVRQQEEVAPLGCSLGDPLRAA